jgi:hypothetical protein
MVGQFDGRLEADVSTHPRAPSLLQGWSRLAGNGILPDPAVLRVGGGMTRWGATSPEEAFRSGVALPYRHGLWHSLHVDIIE